MTNLRSIAFGFFLAYAFIQYFGLKHAVDGEYFPIFSWSLFTDVRDEVVEVTVDIVRIGDQEFDPPRNYFLFPEIFTHARYRDPALGKAAWQLLYFSHVHPDELTCSPESPLI